jgi:uncharacterized lipoprotein YddW (UPF0748 family)
MRRRGFVGLVGRAGLSLAGWQASATVPQKHWAWVHGGGQRTPDAWRRQFARLRAAGLHGVHVGGGDTTILSSAAREAGLVFSRWTWALNRSADAQVKADHPEWFTVSREGNSSLSHPPYVSYYQWLCPTRPEVRRYVAEVFGAVARDPAVDEVHLDYVRHCDVILPVALWPRDNLVQDRELPPYDFCYCEVCRAAFRAQAGRDPLALPDPSRDVEWRRFRWDSVTGLVREVARAVRAGGKPLTAAVFPTPAIARRLVRQAWDEWPLDAVFPMTYHGFYSEGVSWIGGAVREGLAALPEGRPLYAGLYLPDLPPADLGVAVRSAMQAGAAGVSVFEADGLTDAHLQGLSAAVR